MPTDADPRPWESLREIAAGSDAVALDEFLGTLSSGEAARAMAHLSKEDQQHVLRTLAPDDAAELIEELPDAQAADLMEQIPAGAAAAILDEMSSSEQADLLTELRPADAEAILASLDPATAEDIRQLASYPADTAGGLMVTELLHFPDTLTVEQLVGELRRGADDYADYLVQYVYVHDADGRLRGVVRLRDLLLAPGGTAITRLLIESPVTATVDATLEELADLFERHAFRALPAVDEDGRLVGVVRAAAVAEALGDRAEGEHLRSSGIVGGDELRSMPLRTRSLRRLSWLSVNIVLNVIAAGVIAAYEDTLSAVIALAVFLPIISDMSGCSGNQAVAVSMRELSLGLIRPQDVLYVWVKEILVGVVNGAALGVLLGLVAWWWKGNPVLGLVAGGALTLNTMVAVSIGGTVPLILKRLGRDPALASGPILTTITDMCGFFLVLSFATALLPHLEVA